MLWFVLLLVIVSGVVLSCSRGPTGDSSKVRRMVSFSLLENLAEAEVTRRRNAVIEPRMVRVGDERRPAIYAQAPTEIRFKAVRLEPGSVLDFGVGLIEVGVGSKADGVRFVVRKEDDSGGSTELWSQTVSPNTPWIDVELDLDAPEGQVADLVLITEPLANAEYDFAAWSHPVLKSGGAVLDLEDLAMLRETGSTALDTTASVQTLEIPERALLELVGEVRAVPGRRLGGVASAIFSVRVNGEEIFSRSLQLSGKATSFFQALPLDEFGGQTVELSLLVEKSVRQRQARVAGPKPNPRGFEAEWHRGRLAELSPTPRQHRSDGPNLLLIVVDTLRADHLSLYGYGRETSPNLDRLASESLVFERASSQSSWTMPAVASLLTGLYPPEHGVDEQQHLEPQFRTLPEILQENGFTTFAVSANSIVGKQEGFHQGFEKFIHLPEASAGDVNLLFESFVEENRDLRWFGYLHYIDPHDPYRAPGVAANRFTRGLKSRYGAQGDFKRLWRSVNFGRGRLKYTDADIEYLRAAYDEEIFYWDSEFATLIDKLRASGILDNTVVIVTSDHGEEFLEHGKLKHGIQLYDESIWVPLVIRAPDRLAPERRGGEVETLGIIHTALELLEIDGLTERSGGSWGAKSSRQRPAFSFTNHALLAGRSGRGEMVSVQDSEWKLISYLAMEAFELYNLKEDPGERMDRAAGKPEVAARYDQILDRWLESSKPLTKGKGDPSQGTIEKLRALGYLQ